MSSSNLSDTMDEEQNAAGSGGRRLPTESLPSQLSSDHPADHDYSPENVELSITLLKNVSMDPQTSVSMDADDTSPCKQDIEGEATQNSPQDENMEGAAIISSIPVEPDRVNPFSTEDSSDPEFSDGIQPGAVYVEGSDYYDSMTEDSDTESIDSVRRELNPEVGQDVPLPVAVVAEIQEENVEETVQNILGDTGAMLEAFGDDVAIAEEVGSPDQGSVSSEEEKYPPTFCSKKKKRMVGVLTIVVVIVASIIAAVVLSSSSKITLPKKEETTTPKVPPTKYTLIKRIVSGISGLDVVENENTSQHSALVWLSEEDTFDGLNLTDERKVIQRYVLAVFYFATNGDHWNQSYGFLTPADECEWKGRDSDNHLLGVAHCQHGVAEELFFSANNLTGMIPNEIGELSNLRILVIGNDRLTGEIPNSITKLTSLTDLRLLITQLQGNIPNDIGKLTQMKILKLNFNNLSGPIPKSIGKLAKLEELYLEENQLTGHLPESMGNLVNLKQLFLYTNELSGVLPSSFSQLTQLKNIFLSKNDISGGLDSLCGIKFHIFEADCEVPVGQAPLKKPEVDCSCCNRCCVNGEDCQLVY